MIPWLFTALAIMATFGCFLRIRDNMLWCWRILSVANVYFFIHNLYIHEWAEGIFIFVSLCFTIYGWWEEEIEKRTRL
ncbi:MAG: hypothetical protein LBD72_01680 [Puniceicoccales bacterium]|jgi:hypothetical protein|nr:hypothetical protein [Puniceicoccales bacterium]